MSVLGSLVAILTITVFYMALPSHYLVYNSILYYNYTVKSTLSCLGYVMFGEALWPQFTTIAAILSAMLDKP